MKQLVLSAAAAAWLGVALTASAQPREPALLTAPLAAEARLTAAESARLTDRIRALGPQVVRSRPLALDTEALTGPREAVPPRVRLELFDDATLTLVRGKQLRSDGVTHWIGAVEGVERSRAVLSSRAGRTVGVIYSGNRVYEIRPVKGQEAGVHVAIEVDPALFPEDPDDFDPPPAGAPTRRPSEGEMESDEGPAPESEADAAAADASSAGADAADEAPLTRGPILNLMVLYTNDAADAATDIELTAQNAVAVTNTSYEDSGVSQRLHLAHLAPVDYDESGASLATLRNRLRHPSDNEMDGIHALRNQHRADVVALLADAGGGCGIAFIMETVGHAFESSAFSVTRWSCAVGNLSFAHELGHNMSARHDRTVDPTENSPFDHNHGFANTTTGCRTVMAYNTACTNAGTTCTRIGRWSHPTQTACGGSLGTTTDDNVRTLNRTAATVVGFRQLGKNEARDGVGEAVASGDFDGDGLLDLAVAAPGEAPGSEPKSGWVFVYKGTPWGLAAWQGLGQAGIGKNEAGDLFGHSLAAGDFDGDGKDDLAVGAPGESPGSDPKSGWVFLFRGGAAGLSAWKGFGQAGLGANEADDRFGHALAAGDFDGDGKDDLIVGAPGESPGSKPKSGWAFAFHGTPDGPVPWKGFGQGGLGENEAGDLFGHALAAGDFDGDGKDDLAVGAPGESPGSKPKSGWVFTYRGSPSGLSSWKGFGQEGLGADEADDRFGFALAAADFHGDGRDDLVVGAPGESPGSSPKSGWVFVFKGATTGLAPSEGFGQGGLGENENGDLFGTAVTTGDFDADGKADLAVAAPGEAPGSEPRSGWVFVYRGGTSELTSWKGFGQAGLGQNENGDRFGTALVAGDFDADGEDDLAVGAPGEAPGSEPRSGYLFVYKGTAAGPVAWHGLHQEL